MRRVDAEFVIVGGGVMGLAAAWRLAIAGRAVLVLERFVLGHALGSSHGATRIFRYAYEDRLYVQLAQRSLTLWRELDPALVTITGGLDIGDDDFLYRCAAALEAAGAQHAMLDPRELERSFGWVDTRGDRVLFSPDTGVIDATASIERLAAAAADAGAEIWPECIVTALRPDDEGVTIDTAAGPLRARRAVVAAGAWANGLIDLRLPLTVTREQVFYFDGPPETVPVIDRARAPAAYLVPKLGRAPGVKLAEHHAGAAVDPDSRTFETDVEGTARVMAFARERFRPMSGEPIAYETCLYTNTPDEDFIIDRRDNVVIASACSGHGFKFAPLVGESVAALAMDRPPPLPLDRFSLDRF